MPNVDANVISFQCPKCGQDLQQTIGLLKSNQRLVCNSCGVGVARPAAGCWAKPRGIWRGRSYLMKLQGGFRTRTKAKEKANGRVQILHMRASKLLNRQHFRSNPSSAQWRTYVIDIASFS